MGRKYQTIVETIGNTPVVRLRKLVSPSMGEVLVKLEYYNPTGSYKDRMALAMIEGTPVKTRAGNVRNIPPPATELIRPAASALKIRSR